MSNLLDAAFIGSPGSRGALSTGTRLMSLSFGADATPTHLAAGPDGSPSMGCTVWAQALPSAMPTRTCESMPETAKEDMEGDVEVAEGVDSSPDSRWGMLGA